MELVATTDKELENMFPRIISKGEIKTVFQPIVSLLRAGVLYPKTQPFTLSYPA